MTNLPYYINAHRHSHEKKQEGVELAWKHHVRTSHPDVFSGKERNKLAVKGLIVPFSRGIPPQRMEKDKDGRWCPVLGVNL